MDGDGKEKLNKVRKHETFCVIYENSIQSENRTMGILNPQEGWFSPICNKNFIIILNSNNMKIEISNHDDNQANVTISAEDLDKMLSAVEAMNGVLNQFTSGQNLNTKITLISFYLSNVSQWFFQNVQENGKSILAEDEWVDMFALQAKSWNHQLPFTK